VGMKHSTLERSNEMFRRNRNRYMKVLVAGLGLAALIAPSSALAGGSSSTHNMSGSAYQAMLDKSQALNARYGNAVTGLSSQQFIELYKDGGSKLSPEALNQIVVLGQAMNARYGGSGGGSHNMSSSAYKALVAKSEALNVRYSTAARYGAPDGWTPYVESLTSASRYGAPDGWTPYVESLTTQSQNAVIDGRSQDIRTTEQGIALSKSLTPVDGRSPDTKDSAQTVQAQNMAQIDGRSQDIRTTEQGIALSQSLTPVDGRSPDTIDEAVQAHSPVVSIVQSPGFHWGDFGIGTAAALGAVALLFFSLRRMSGRQGRKPVAAA
jgi:hypothetical protein